MGKGEQKILLSSVSRGLVTQMSDTLIHKKQLQQEIYKNVKFNQIHGIKREMHDTKWTFSSNTQPFDYDIRYCGGNEDLNHLYLIKSISFSKKSWFILI